MLLAFFGDDWFTWEFATFGRFRCVGQSVLARRFESLRDVDFGLLSDTVFIQLGAGSTQRYLYIAARYRFWLGRLKC